MESCIRGVTPVSSTSATSVTVALIIALEASTEAPVAEGPKLLAVVGAVVVHVVEGAERAVGFG